MLYLVALFVGMVTGAVCTFILLNRRIATAREAVSTAAAEKQQARRAYEMVRKRESDLDKREVEFRTAAHLREEALKERDDALQARVISLDELANENVMLKRDLKNLDIMVRKLALDRDTQQVAHDLLDAKTMELGQRYLKENVKWIGVALNPNNFVACKQKLLEVIERCRAIGYKVSKTEENQLVADLKSDFEKAVRAALEREEQVRIKAQIREEQRVEREIQHELQRLERERTAIQAALDKALAEAKDAHSAEVEQLRARLAEAEEHQRAVSQAQLTKSGHVYVISNIGSFGDGVFKIGVTRRLEPHDRVRELGDASVPFPFDVHMMISADDAPSLEKALHRALYKNRLNKVNPRKEFFRSDIEAICAIVKECHGEVEYVADAEALEFHQSQSMTDEDVDYVESVYESQNDNGLAPEV